MYYLVGVSWGIPGYPAFARQDADSEQLNVEQLQQPWLNRVTAWFGVRRMIQWDFSTLKWGLHQGRWSTAWWFHFFTFSISDMGCHPNPIDELHHFSRWFLNHQPVQDLNNRSSGWTSRDKDLANRTGEVNRQMWCFFQPQCWKLDNKTWTWNSFKRNGDRTNSHNQWMGFKYQKKWSQHDETLVSDGFLRIKATKIRM